MQMAMEGGGAGGTTLSEIYQSSKHLLLKSREGLERLERLELSSATVVAMDSPELSLQRDIGQIQSLCVDMDRLWRSVAARTQRDLWKRNKLSVEIEMEISLQPMLKKKKNKNKMTRNQNLPNEVIESNILTRLPVKTLLRFRTTCKSWHSIISDPWFINIHHQNQIKKTEKPNLLLVEYRHPHGTEDLSVITGCCFPPEQSWSSFNNAIDFPPVELVLVKRSVVSSCGGLVCVLDSYYHLADETSKFQIRLWNPALRNSKVIPCHERLAKFVNLYMGFGYHSQTNDYNVIVFSNKSFALKDVEIYSLNLDSWRTIILGKSNDQLLKDIQAWYGGVYVGCFPRGAYFWLADKRSHDDNGTSDSIEDIETKLISFDMEDEQFKEIMLPYKTVCHNNTIFMYKNSLAVLHTYSPDNRCRFGDIWVMMECYDPRSWTKLYSFDFHFAYATFKGVVENDLIQLLCGDQSSIQDPLFEEAKVVDLDKSQVSTTTCRKTIRFLKKIMRLSSFTESLTGLASFDKSKAA